MMRKSPDIFREKKNAKEETQTKNPNLQNGLLFDAVVMRQERVGSRRS
jgi:hypothetical protein